MLKPFSKEPWRSSLKSRMSHLLDGDECFTHDVVFRVGKIQQEFRAHKLLISLASPRLGRYFAARPGIKTSKVSLNIDADSFHKIIKYIYTDELELNGSEEASRLSEAANRLEMYHLYKKCRSYLKGKQMEVQEKKIMRDKSTQANADDPSMYLDHVQACPVGGTSFTPVTPKRKANTAAGVLRVNKEKEGNIPSTVETSVASIQDKLVQKADKPSTEYKAIKKKFLDIVPLSVAKQGKGSLDESERRVTSSSSRSTHGAKLTGKKVDGISQNFLLKACANPWAYSKMALESLMDNHYWVKARARAVATTAEARRKISETGVFETQDQQGSDSSFQPEEHSVPEAMLESSTDPCNRENVEPSEGCVTSSWSNSTHVTKLFDKKFYEVSQNLLLKLSATAGARRNISETDVLGTQDQHGSARSKYTVRATLKEGKKSSAGNIEDKKALKTTSAFESSSSENKHDMEQAFNNSMLSKRSLKVKFCTNITIPFGAKASSVLSDFTIRVTKGQIKLTHMAVAVDTTGIREDCPIIVEIRGKDFYEFKHDIMESKVILFDTFLCFQEGQEVCVRVVLENIQLRRCPLTVRRKEDVKLSDSISVSIDISGNQKPICNNIIPFLIEKIGYEFCP